MALAVVLLVASGLMIRTFQSLRRVQPRFSNTATLPAMRGALIATVTVPWRSSCRMTLNVEAYTIGRAAAGI